MPILPNRIRQARLARRLSQEKLAALLSEHTGRPVRVQHISSWERGKARPTAVYFDALRELLSRKAGFFYGEGPDLKGRAVRAMKDGRPQGWRKPGTDGHGQARTDTD